MEVEIGQLEGLASDKPAFYPRDGDAETKGASAKVNSSAYSYHRVHQISTPSTEVPTYVHLVVSALKGLKSLSRRVGARRAQGPLFDHKA